MTERRNFRDEKFDIWESGYYTISNVSHNREQFTISNNKTNRYHLLNSGIAIIKAMYPPN